MDNTQRVKQISKLIVNNSQILSVKGYKQHNLKMLSSANSRCIMLSTLFPIKLLSDTKKKAPKDFHI